MKTRTWIMNNTFLYQQNHEKEHTLLRVPFLLFKTQNTPATLFGILMPPRTYSFQTINDNVLSTQLTAIIDHGCKLVFGSANVTVQSSAWSSLGCSTQVLF